MSCNHEKVRCTDGIYYCLLCGTRINFSPIEEEIPAQKENAPQASKTAAKRKGKKEAQENG